MRTRPCSFGWVVWVGILTLICDGTQAQKLFESDNGSGTIYVFAPDGTRTTFASGLNHPAGLAFNRVGDLFVADAGSGNVYKFTPAGVRSTFASGLMEPVALAFDSAGDLFVADDVAGGIYEFSPGGDQTTFAVVSGVPSGLAFNSAGDLFVTTCETGDIYEITPGGVQSTFASVTNSIVLLLPSLYQLAFNSVGDLFVANNTGNIVEFTPDGAQRTFASGLVSPCGLAIDSAGNVFDAEAEPSGIIYEFTSNGTRMTFASGLNNPVGLAFQPVPHLRAVATGDAFKVSVTMPSPYCSTIVQASTDMVNWVNICTNMPPFTFTNTAARTSLQCFYRAALGP